MEPTIQERGRTGKAGADSVGVEFWLGGPAGTLRNRLWLDRTAWIPRRFLLDCDG